MKNLSHSIAFVSLVSILLSSCSRLENLTISKRHYRSGYYVDFGSSKKDVITKSNSKNLTQDSTPEVNTETPSSIQNITEANNNTVSPDKETIETRPNFLMLHAEKKIKSPNETSENFYASNQNNSDIVELVKAEELKSINSFTDAFSVLDSNSSQETPMWLLIVFAIILPPLAVGLKFGIINKFWISVILTLLFWVPGVIYALIVITQE